MTHTCFIIPPHIHRAIVQNGTKEQQDNAHLALEISAQLRGLRIAHALYDLVPEQETAVTVIENRSVYDCKHLTWLPGLRVRKEGQGPSRDLAVNQAYDGAGSTWQLYQSIFQRNSVDNKGMKLVSSVHYARRYNNAFWNGSQMVYGDGDGQIFKPFTGVVDVIGHELTHGVSHYTANLDYQDQSGALNESVSDCFGSMVKQFALNQTVDQADWLIGAGLFTSKIHGVALRSMKAPGTAYDDPLIGKDPQPDHMSKYVNTQDDNGGVHINSGIPNRAFYLTALALGGHSWERAGKMWYHALTEGARSSTNFVEFAQLTIQAASSPEETHAVTDAWKTVGVLP